MENSLLAEIGFTKYKSFKEETPTYIPMDNNVTVIIGRNNSGKSSLIDVLEASEDPFNVNKDIEGIRFGFELDDEHIKRGIDPIYNSHEYNTAIRFDSKIIVVEPDRSRFVLVDDAFIFDNRHFSTEGRLKSNWKNVAGAYTNELNDTVIRRVNADRNIVPEQASANELVGPDGAGATNLVQRFINLDRYDEQIVEEKILHEMNIIMNPDANYNRIRVQQLEGNDLWEIFLEDDGNRYALSKSGSGLKTILLILINLYLIPKTSGYRYKSIIYAFEEIENNLHPALQRRVFDYLYNYAKNNDARLFITTHSNVAINAFYGKEKCSLLHVTKNNRLSHVHLIESGKEKTTILDDLDVKASDLLQSNGIIWVEGPSDRIYILKWLEAFTPFDCIEGRDFQFMYYGGRLLAHYTANNDCADSELIKVLTVNRHAAIVIDSDKKYANTRINDTKKRVKEEFESLGLFCWITKGKEIENYLSAEAVNIVHNSNLPQIEQFELFPDYIETQDKTFKNHKVISARKYSDYITYDNSKDILDLKKRIEALYETIKAW